MGTVKVDGQDIQKRYDFPGTTLPSDWTVVALGSGMAVSVASSILTITSGTTISAETVVRCSKPIQIKSLVRYIAMLSQRIVNQNIYFEVVNEAGTTWARWNLNGATNTTCQVESANVGTANSAVSVTTAATSAYLVYEIALEPEQVIFNCTATNSSTYKSGSSLFDRLIPEPGENYYMQIRVTNGGSAPASSTTVSVDAVVVEDLTMLGVEILRASGDTNAATCLLTRSQGGTIDTCYIRNVITHYADTTANLAASATFTGTTRDLSTTYYLTTHRTFVSSDQPGNLFIEQSADGSVWYTMQTIAVVANVAQIVDQKIGLRYCRIRFTNTSGSTQTAFRIETSFIATGAN